MPEFVAIGVVGAFVTFIFVNLNLYWVHKSFQKPEYLILNHNLQKISKYWSLEQGQIVDISPHEGMKAAKLQDYKKSTRSAFLFGTVLIFLSWIGLVFFGIYYLSVNVLAKSRLEKKIFSTNLVEDKNLSIEQVQTLLKESIESV